MFEYDGWANRRVLDALKKAASPPAKAVALLAHILASQRTWLARLRGQDTATIAVWPENDLAACEKTLAELTPAIRSYLEGATDSELDRVVNYRNTQGKAFANAVRDILTHVAFHSHYHRGQIAARLRDAGAEPTPTDFIVYSRESAAPPR